MTDVVDPRTRSRIMASIRARHTKPELLVRRFLHARGFRYRLHVSGLPGTPDLVFPRWRAAVFVHGCFWHQHPGCSLAVLPEQNREKWTTKFRGTRERDIEATRELEADGWRIATVWECGLTKATTAVAASTLAELEGWLLHGKESIELPSQK